MLFLQTLIAFGAEAVLEADGAASVAKKAIEALSVACDIIPHAGDALVMQPAHRADGLRMLGRFATAVGAPAAVLASIHAHAGRAYGKANKHAEASQHYLRACVPTEHANCLANWCRELPASEHGMVWAKTALQ